MLSNKRKKFFIVISALLLIVMGIGGTYWFYHPTHYRYNDRLVIGKTAAQIEERYGDFDKVFYYENGELASAGYLTEPSKITYLGKTWPKYYFIKFQDGKAISVKIVEGGWGG